MTIYFLDKLITLPTTIKYHLHINESAIMYIVITVNTAVAFAFGESNCHKTFNTVLTIRRVGVFIFAVRNSKNAPTQKLKSTIALSCNVFFITSGTSRSQLRSSKRHKLILPIVCEQICSAKKRSVLYISPQE